MIRFEYKVFQKCVNQVRSNIFRRTLSNVPNQVTSKSFNQNLKISSFPAKINQDQLQKELPSYHENNHNFNDSHSILDNYNNVFGYIKNYRQIYIENPNVQIEAPAQSKTKETIQAARLIVIRRRKMKKHKLKKLRKKMKFEWAKVRQRREMRKEKAFQAVLINQIKIAEKFSAEEYVEAKLKQANETPIPRFWKGKRLPAFIIKEKLGIK